MIREQVLGIVAMEPMGEYSANVKYEKLNIVTYNGSTYSALKDTLGNEPTNDEYWQLIAKKGDKGDTYVMTEEDKEEVISEITDNANSVFNKNVDEKTTNFNSNASKKVTAFNTNSTNKTNDYNTNASSKLGAYNENATSKLEDYNSNAEAKINEYNNNANELIDSVTDTRNELERVKNDILETGEVNADYVHIVDSTMAELQELEVNSVEKQLTTTGKNLIDINEVKVPISSYKLPHTLSAGTYTISCKNVNLEMGFRLSNTTDTSTNSVVKTGINVIGNRQYLTLTTTFEANYINLSCTGIEKLEEIMLELGDVPTEYEPYTGLKPSPSPDYPQEIPVITTDSVLKSVGKNVYNATINEQTSGDLTWKADNEKIYINGIGDDTKHTFKCQLFKKGTYTFYVEKVSGTQVKNIALNIYKRGTWDRISTAEMGINDTDYKGHRIFTLEEDTELELGFYSMLTNSYTNVELKYLIKRGDVIKYDFEPYQESILNLSIPEGEFVGYINDDLKDTLRVGYNEEDGNYHLYLDKMLGKVVLDGNEEIKLGGVYENITQFDYIMNNQVLYINDNIARCISNHFVSTHFNNSWTRDNTVTLTGNSIRFMSSTFTTVEEFKTWLSTNNVTAIYALANPYTLDLGIVDMPLSYDGTTNIFVDTDILTNINTKYYRNFTETIRNLQINNDTLKNELASIESRLSALETSRASVVSESEVVE